MRIEWLPEAVEDLDRIHSFWLSKDEGLARRVATLLLDMAQNLSEFDERGRISYADPNSRELISRFGSGAFILRYCIVDDLILVVQVKHSREER